MAISVDEIWDGRGGSTGLDNSNTETRRLRAITDSASIDGIAVRAYVLTFIPLGSFHPNDATTRLASVEAQQQIEDPLIWIVTLSYERRLVIPGGAAELGGGGGGGGSNTEGEPNPLLRSDRYSFRSETYQETLEYDLSDIPVPIENSAGEPFDGATTERGRLLFTMQRNRAANPWREYEELLYCTNAAPFVAIGGGGFAFGTAECLFVDYTADLVVEQIAYWQITTTFRLKSVNKGPWNFTDFVDRGFREHTGTYDSGNPIFALILDKHGHPLQRPAKLDGGGSRLKDGEPPVNLTFTFHPLADFTVLE